MRPHVGETTSACAARLREKAKECEFGTIFHERILKHIIQKKPKPFNKLLPCQEAENLDVCLAMTSSLSGQGVLGKDLRSTIDECC